MNVRYKYIVFSGFIVCFYSLHLFCVLIKETSCKRVFFKHISHSSHSFAKQNEWPWHPTQLFDEHFGQNEMHTHFTAQYLCAFCLGFFFFFPQLLTDSPGSTHLVRLTCIKMTLCFRGLNCRSPQKGNLKPIHVAAQHNPSTCLLSLQCWTNAK